MTPAQRELRIRVLLAELGDLLTAPLDPPEAPPLAVTITEAARLLGLSRSTVYGLIHDGRLRTVTVGRRRMVPRTEIARLLAGPDEATA